MARRVTVVAGALLLMLAAAPGMGQTTTGATAPAMITNSEFRAFRPAHTYGAKEAQEPAVMTEREANDYTLWSNKRIGTDLVWRPLPTSPGKGVLLHIVPGMGMEDLMHEPKLPVLPPGMVYVPEGAFTMGSDVGDPDEAPKHTANAGPFFIDRYEVGNAEFKEAFPDHVFEPGRENHPAIVTWEQAAAYAAKVGKRLPTEAEWEKAARGLDGRTFPWGETYDPSFISWNESYPRGGAPARPESPYGCIDMAGGAWEWTADWYQPYEGNDVPSEQYGEQYKVIRGGASFNDVAMIRTSHRYYLPPNTTGNLYVGFRCVKDVE